MKSYTDRAGGIKEKSYCVLVICTLLGGMTAAEFYQDVVATKPGVARQSLWRPVAGRPGLVAKENGDVIVVHTSFSCHHHNLATLESCVNVYAQELSVTHICKPLATVF